MIRVMAICAEPLLRSAASVLDCADDVSVIAWLSSALEAVAELPRAAPDVLLLEYAAAGVREIRPEHPVLAPLAPLPRVLVAPRADLLSVGELSPGLAGLVVAESAGAELLPALRAAATGARFARLDLGKSASGRSDIAAQRVLWLSRLTQREREVFGLLCEGCVLGQVADQLGISLNTAKVHRSRVIAKLHLRTTADLRRFIVTRGLAF